MALAAKMRVEPHFSLYPKMRFDPFFALTPHGQDKARFLIWFTSDYVNRLYAYRLVELARSERMSESRNDGPGDTVRLLRPPPRVFTDPCGHNVWMGEVEVLELELEPASNTDPYNSAG